MQLNTSEPMTIKRVSLVDAVMDQMIAAVQSGRFKQGDKIPSEKVLAQEFGVSRATLREAFKRLESSGLLNIRQGDGTYLQNVDLFQEPASQEVSPQGDDVVAQINAARTLEPTVASGTSVVTNTSYSLSDFLDAREAIETEAAELAALRATEQDIERLEKIIEMQSNALNDPTLFSDLDLAFHGAILDIADSKILYNFWHELMPNMRKNSKESSMISGVPENAFHTHQQILELIKSREDMVQLRTLIVEHIRIVPGRFLFR